MKLKELRLAAGLSQKDLAEKINLTAHNIGDWEREKAEPSIYWLDKLAGVFNCSIDYLVGREDDFGNITILSDDLSKDDEEILQSFRRLSSKGKTLAIEIIRSLEKHES